GPFAPYTQSERLPLYQTHARQLVDSGKAYYCFCSKDRLTELRTTQQANKELPRYDKHCRNLDPQEAAQRVKDGVPHVIRLKIPLTGVTVCRDTIRGDVSFQNSGIDDQVILKSDGYPTYHLAVVVDDHLMGITHIVRGEEWLSSSPKHILLYEAFGWPLPIFAHLPIIRNKDHSKMSKRKNDVSILSHRDRGYLPEALNNFMGLMGWSHPEKKEIFSLLEFQKLFSLDRVTMTAPVYDLEKLDWLNGQYIRALSNKELEERLQNFLPSDCPKKLVSKIIPLIKERLVTLKDFEQHTSFFYREIKVDPTVLHKKSNIEQVKTQLEESSQLINKLSDSEYTVEHLEASFRSLAEENDWKPSQFFMMLRIAVTGEKATPPLFDTFVVLGKDKVISRLTRSTSS
ncbi:MAG: glutamate--tRNA ligase, partial [bacterium]